MFSPNNFTYFVLFVGFGGFWCLWFWWVFFGCLFAFFFNFSLHRICFSTDFYQVLLVGNSLNAGAQHTAHLCLGLCSSVWREARFSLDITGYTSNTHTLSCLGHSQLPLNVQYLLIMWHWERLQRTHEKDLNHSWGINNSGHLAFVPKPFLITMNVIVTRKYLPNSLCKQIATYGSLMNYSLHLFILCYFLNCVVSLKSYVHWLDD